MHNNAEFFYKAALKEKLKNLFQNEENITRSLICSVHAIKPLF